MVSAPKRTFAMWTSASGLERAIVEKIEKGILRIPPFPAVALELRKLLSRKNYGLEDLLPIVSSDPALASRVLRFANSAYVGLGKVTSLQQAVGWMGAQKMLRLSLISGLAAGEQAPGPLASLHQRAWEDSLASAAICERLAKMRKLSVDDAFIAGLLHNVGALVCIGTIEEMLAIDLHAPEHSESFWMAVIENCHAPLGVALAKAWNLPQLIVDVIARHHEPERASEFARILELVRISDRIDELLLVHPHVSADLLASAIPELSALECASLARGLPEIPALMSGVAVEPRCRPVRAIISRAEQEASDALRAIDLPVAPLGVRSAVPYRMTAWSPARWIMTGPLSLLENQLVEMKIVAPSQTLRFSAKIESCGAAAHGNWELSCRPFALDEATMASWSALGNTSSEQRAGAN